MSEFLIAARDLDSGYKQGDPITVQADGHPWGDAEGLPDFWIVKTPDFDLAVARATVTELFQLAIPGDPESLAPDIVDRKIKRGRRQARFFVDDLPRPKRDELASVGVTTLTFGQAHSTYRRLQFNRSTGRVENTGLAGFA